MMIASHNTFSYLPSSKFMELFSCFWRCQDKNAIEQIKLGVELCDIRVKYHKDSWRLCHGKAKTFEIHLLVAKAFVPNPNNLPMVNHIDEDKTNNHVENLEWCTNQYNVRYSNAKAVDVYTKDGEFIETLEAITDAAAKYNSETSNISACCKKKYGTCNGYQFRYHGEPFQKKPFVFTEYQRRKSRKGHSCNEGKYIPINVYKTDGTFVKTYDNISQAASAYNTTTGNICKCYKGKLLTNKGYIFLLDTNIDARLLQLSNRKHKSKSEKSLYEL